MRRRNPATCVLIILALLMVFYIMQSQGASASPAAEPAATISIAVLEPEVVGELPPEQRQALTAAVDALLMQSLAEREGVTLVDRQTLDAVLAEHELAAGGVAKLDVDAVAAPLRPFWSAGVLVVTEVDAGGQLLIVEAVSAQRGSRLGGFYLPLPQVDGKTVVSALGQHLEPLWDDLQAAVATATDQPVVEVTAELPAGLERSRWLAEDAAMVARSRVALVNHLILLTPRRPLATKEERLLRLMGLAEAQVDDRAARLRASPDAVLRLRVTEQEGVGRTFSQTPVTLHVELAVGEGEPISESFITPAERWSDVLAAMSDWLDAQLAGLGDVESPAVATDDDRARALAQREMAIIEPWTKLTGSQIDRLPLHLRMRLHELATRALHLDPTHEPAARLVVLTLMAEHEAIDWSERPDNYFNRILTEGQRYLERFGDRHPQHHREVLYHVIRTGAIRARMLDPERRYGRREGLFAEPKPIQYQLARLYVPAMAEVGVRSLTDETYAGSNDLFVFGQFLVGYLIPNIPEQHLEQEYARWRAFYDKHIAPLPAEVKYMERGVEVVVPWELVAAAFAARRGEPAAVRRHLQALAEIYPKRVGAIWGGTQYQVPLIPTLLKAAGDPQWQTWQPTFGTPADLHVSLDEMTALMARLSPRATRPWDGVATHPLPGVTLRVPEAVRDASFRKGSTMSRSVEAVLQTDEVIWLIAPGIAPGNSDVDVQLFVGLLKADDAAAASLDVTPIAWPEADRLPGRPKWSYAHAIQHHGGWVVFMGTEGHGLLRLDRVEGRWSGRWLNTRHGLPANGVRRLATCMHNGETELLVIGGDHHEGRMHPDVLMVWSVNLDTDVVTQIHDGRPEQRQIRNPAAILCDGRKVHLELAGTDAYPEAVDLADIVSLEASGASSMRQTPTPFTRPALPGETARLWSIGWDGERHSLRALDPVTLKQLDGLAPGDGARDDALPAVARQVLWVLGDIAYRSGGSYAAPRVDHWPSLGMPFAAGGGNIVWIGLNTDWGWDGSHLIVGYRPAPHDTDDWAADDLWIGPFRTPGRELTLGLRSAQQSGTFLLSTTGHVMLLDEDQMLAQAERVGAVRSTRQWREQYRARLAKAGWQSVVSALMVDERYDEALNLLAEARNQPNVQTDDRQRQQVLDFWTARVLADMPDRSEDAIAIYERIATQPGVSAAAEAFARANQVVLLHRQRRWAELLAVAEDMAKRFPQTRSPGPGRGLAWWYIAEARRQLDAEENQPVDDPPIPE